MIFKLRVYNLEFITNLIQVHKCLLVLNFTLYETLFIKELISFLGTQIMYDWNHLRLHRI